jgi:hypothetical protein
MTTEKARTTALARRDPTAMERQYDNGRYHYLAPRMMIDELPAGMRLVATRVDVDTHSDDVYQIPGGSKVGIAKAKLNALAAGAGITFTHSKRVDDKRHPHYVEWEVGGRMVMPDGSVREETANKAVDLRSDIGDGTQGADLEKITSLAAKKKRDPSGEIVQQRQHILSMAETKAKNRLIRSMVGLQTSYERKDLGKPFVMVKLAVDPSSELGGKAAMAAMYGATNALFAPAPAPIIDAEVKELPAPDENEDEVTTPETPETHPETPEADGEGGGGDVLEQLMKVWQYAEKHEMPAATFREISFAATGKQRKADFEAADIERVVQAVEDWIAVRGQSGDRPE